CAPWSPLVDASFGRAGVQARARWPSPGTRRRGGGRTQHHHHRPRDLLLTGPLNRAQRAVHEQISCLREGTRLVGMRGFGIDIGGSGTKGAPVDLESGELTAPRFKIATPKPATPDAVADVAAKIFEHFQRDDAEPIQAPIGVAIPAVADHGVARSAANI